MSWLGKLNRSANSDLDSNWRDVSYCAIDLETTGLDFETDEIISIGATQIRSARIIAEENFYREVRPKNNPSASSIRIHGIRAVDLTDASELDMVLPEVGEILRGRVVIAHAAWVETGFLKERLAHLNLDFSKRLIDTASLARACGVADQKIGHEPSLEYLARTLKLPVYSPHNALGDALTTSVIFLALATQLEDREIERGGSALTLRELLRLSGKSPRRP